MDGISKLVLFPLPVLAKIHKFLLPELRIPNRMDKSGILEKEKTFLNSYDPEILLFDIVLSVLSRIAEARDFSEYFLRS